MNPFERKVTVRVLSIHLGVVALLVIQSGLKGCFRSKPKPEIVTFIEFGEPAPEVNVQEVAKMSNPEPPAPEPTPEPAALPEPKPKPVPKPAPKPEPKPAPKPKPKPKWKPVDPKDIKIGKPVKTSTPKPTVSEADIKQALSDIVRPATTAATGNPNAFAAYDSKIYSIFYGAWKQPATAASRPANVRISIDSNGHLRSRKLVQSSGDSSFDQTAMAAVNSVSVLPKPPAGYPLNDIVIQFRLVD